MQTTINLCQLTHNTNNLYSSTHSTSQREEYTQHIIKLYQITPTI
jgi:hypothetical protein